MVDKISNSLKSWWNRFFAKWGWTLIETPPKWVVRKSDGYYEYFIGKYGVRPYDVIKIFKGKTYLYKVVFYTVAQGQITPIFYVKKR